MLQQNLPTQLKLRLPHPCFVAKGLTGTGCQSHRREPNCLVDLGSGQMFSWDDGGKAPPHTFSLDVLTNIFSQLFRGDQQLMHAKAGARIITHGSHTAPNSCPSAKFLPGSQRHGVHFVCPSMCSLKMILEQLELIMKWSLWMNEKEKIKQTQRNTSQNTEPERMGFM